MSDTKRICPLCQAEITEDSAEGLCVGCLLRQAASETRQTDSDSSSPPSPPSDRPPVPSLEEVAKAFEQLEIIELIGVGGMGAVFKARQPKLNRFVALKILSTNLSKDKRFADRFMREGQLLARLNHPNIVTVHDFGESGGFYYLMMEYVDGVNLRQAMRSEHFSSDQTLSIVAKICEALQFAHNEGVLHRDIKPENILLDTKGRVKIADFGIASVARWTANGAAAPLPKPAPDGRWNPPEEKLTQTGQILGTPSYMAPEQLDDPNGVDHRADIFSLGVVFYELLTGELPRGRFPVPSEKTPVDAEVDRIVLKALQKERNKRQQSADELKTEILTASISPVKRPGLWKRIVAEMKTWPIWATILVVCIAGPMVLYVPFVFFASILFLVNDRWVDIHKNWPIYEPLITPLGLLLLALIVFLLWFGKLRKKRISPIDPEHRREPASPISATADRSPSSPPEKRPEKRSFWSKMIEKKRNRPTWVKILVPAVVIFFILGAFSMNPFFAYTGDLVPLFVPLGFFAMVASIVITIVAGIVIITLLGMRTSSPDSGSSSPTLFCTHCGNKQEGNAYACPKCGFAPRAKRNFCYHCGAKTDPEQIMCVQCGSSLTLPNPILLIGGKKDRFVAALFALLLGWLGVHKFYLGSWGWGLVYLLFFWSSIPFIVGIIEGIVFLAMDDMSFDIRYNQTHPAPFRW